MKTKLSFLIALISIFIWKNDAVAQNCPGLNVVVSSFHNIGSWPQSYAAAQGAGHCSTFNSPYPSTLCFEYEVPTSDTMLFSFHVNTGSGHTGCGGTNSVNTGSYGGGCSGVGGSSGPILGYRTYDKDCNLIGNAAYFGKCGGAVAGDILTVCVRISDTTTCDGITICPTAKCGGLGCSSGLPVDLSYFRGYCSSGVSSFKWTTLSEVNNDFFTLERSYDGFIFEPVAIINGAGNSSEAIHYKYELRDEYETGETVYYMLKQTDFDGGFSYSRMVSIKCNDNNEVVIFPNPTSDFIQVNTQSQIKKISLTNNIGQTVLVQEADKNEAELDVKLMDKGLYFIRIELENNQMVTKKVVID